MTQTATEKGCKGAGMEGFTARWYAKLTSKEMDRFKTLARRVASELPANARVLEVAPGPGYFAIELARLGHFRITGLDIGHTFVEIARRNAAEAGVKVDFRQGNASRMPFAAQMFDFVICSAAFKNFTDPVGALQEMYRVLAPGGRALIIDLRRDASNKDISNAVNHWNVGAVNRVITKLTFRFMLLKRAYTKADFERMIRQTKFQPYEITAPDALSYEVSLQRRSEE
jgi:ubiquinone/menaquinone biosynthesis C-methylase UbiE